MNNINERNKINKMKKLLLFLTLTIACTLYGNAQQLPSVQVKNLDGKTVDTSTLSNDGKPIIISFFATWCKPCLRELNAIHEIYEEWQEETGVKVIAISTDEAQNVNKVKPLVDRFGWNYEVLLDTNSDFKRALNVNQIPAVFIIDGKGNIVESRTGYTDGSENHLIEKVRELIRK
jgi:peroxiredoxin